MIIHTWHRWMVLSEIATFLIYLSSMVLLQTYFDITFISTWDFVWKVIVTTVLSTGPLIVVKIVNKRLNPPKYAKLTA